MTNIDKLAQRLRKRTEWQELPRALEPAEYIELIVYGIEQLFIQTSRPDAYIRDGYSVDEGGNTQYAGDFSIDETEYIILSAQIQLFNKAKAMVNARVGYTTDAFSVTNADKPYLYISDTIKELKKERDIIHYKFAHSF